MPSYQLNWITRSLATGYAPMSYSDLDSIREQGINAIVNLCDEYCDLHELEEKSGFEVYYLPIPDESAPDIEDLEKALAWMDEALHLGKKILVHCRHGIGRTGTFVTSYLLRKGLGLKRAEKTLKKHRAKATSYLQWRLLKKYNKKSGELKVREPSLESPHRIDLNEYFKTYETLIRKIDQCFEEVKKKEGINGEEQLRNTCCCDANLTLIEAVYLSHGINKILKSDDRKKVIDKALIQVDKKRQEGWNKQDPNGALRETNLCPLNDERNCLLFDYRPISCRLQRLPSCCIDANELDSNLHELSQQVFKAITGQDFCSDAFVFSLAQTVSGRFIQEYFYFLIGQGM